MQLMRNLRNVVAVVLVFVSVGYSQVENDLISGPIPGLTFVPQAGHLGLSAQYISGASNSSFDSDGELNDLNENYERIADPDYVRSMVFLRVDYSITSRMGVYVVAPYVKKAELDWNMEPTFTGALDDLSGQTGLGDVNIGGWYRLLDKKKQSVNVSGAYVLATGTSPDEINDTDLSSTGAGHTALIAAVSADFVASPTILLSLTGQYQVNQEANFEIDDLSISVENANVMQILGRFTYSLSKNLSIGMDADYFSARESKLDDEMIEETDYSGLLLTPMIGHHDTTNELNMRIRVGYQLTYSGRNILKYDGPFVGLSIIF